MLKSKNLKLKSKKGYWRLDNGHGKKGRLNKRTRLRCGFGGQNRFKLRRSGILIAPEGAQFGGKMYRDFYSSPAGAALLLDGKKSSVRPW